MEYRQIGTSGIAVSPLTLGGNVFGWTVDKATSFRLLDAFIDRGFNAVDTADVYSVFGGTAPGASESVIGEWLAQGGGRREKICLFTKFGLEMGPGLKGQSAAYVEQAVEASLRRLQTDHIDLYILHWDDGATPHEETFGAFEKLIAAGKVRTVGASNYGPERLTDAMDVARRTGLPGYQSLQTLYNLYDRAAFEGPLEDICRTRGLAVFPYFSLASGFLTGKYRKAEDLAGSAREGLVKRFLDPRGLRILAAMDEVSEATGASLAQIALAWLLAKPAVTSPVVSATSLDQLDRTLASVELALSPAQVEMLDAASAAD
jgi:aryl-alcohol dehydrogenase-like predicted oxidoreductase